MTSELTTTTAGRLLTWVAHERRTGAVVAGGHPGGTLYFFEGHVTYAESAAAPGVGELLTASGRLAGRTWQAALDAGTASATIGELLVGQGHLTQGELELCVLGATYDAAYFALAGTDAPAEFQDGAVHWLGPVVRVEAAAVSRESRRRARLLDEILADPRVDNAAVSPVPRPPAERVTLTAPQWELLVHADGQRTPADLALLLGRAGYATVQELRRLAALGLLELPPAREAAPEHPDFVRLPRTRGTAVDARRPAEDEGSRTPAGPTPTPAAPTPTPAGSSRDSEPGSAPESEQPSTPVSAPVCDPVLKPASTPGQALLPDQALAPSGGTTGGVYRRPRLAQRRPGAKLPKDVTADPSAPPGTDEVLLKRIRTALRALR